MVGVGCVKSAGVERVTGCLSKRMDREEVRV